MGLWRVHVQLADRPGRLAELASAIGAAGANIVSLTVLGERGPDGSVTDELLVDGDLERAGSRAGDRRAGWAAGLAERIRSTGMTATLVVPAGADELSDPVTTSLALARRVLDDPALAPRAVAGLLHARHLDSGDGPADGHVLTVRIHDREVRLWRAWPFTATERSRAAVLIELASRGRHPGGHRPGEADDPTPGSGSGTPEALGLVLLGNGSEVELRLATADDGPLVAALHARCTPDTRQGRFLDPSPVLPERQQDELLAGRSGQGRGLLALTTDGGHAVGLATLEPDSDPHPGGSAAALALLVEDAWQARGVGTALVRRAVEVAARSGHQELTAVTHAGNLRVTRLLRRAGLRPTGRLVDGMLRVRAPLPLPDPPTEPPPPQPPATERRTGTRA